MRTSATGTDPRSVLGRAVRILRCFTSGDDTLSFGEVTRRTNIPKATVYRLAKELSELRIVECTGEGVRLGIGLFELGELVPRQRSLREAALPYMQDLQQATEKTVHLAILDRREVLYIEKLPGRSGPELPSRVGGRMPAYCTGVGKAMLAHSDPALIQEIIDIGLRRRAPHTIISARVLGQQLSHIRELGVAFEHEESSRGVECVACPVLRPDGSPIAALSISGWVNRLDAAKFAPAVKTAALSFSRQLRENSELITIPGR